MRERLDPPLELREREPAVVLGGPAVERVEVDAVQHGHAVPHAARNSATARRSSPSSHRPARPHVARRLDEHEPDAPAAALLVAPHGRDHGPGVDGAVERRRNPA